MLDSERGQLTQHCRAETVSKAMGSEAEKIAYIEQSFRDKQEEYVQVAELLGKQQAEYEQGMQQILGIGDQSLEDGVDPSPAKSRSHIEVWGLDFGVGKDEDEDDIEEILLQKETVVDGKATERLGRSLGGVKTEDMSMRTSDLFEISAELETQTPLRSAPAVTVEHGAGHQEVNVFDHGSHDQRSGDLSPIAMRASKGQEQIAVPFDKMISSSSAARAVGKPRGSSLDDDTLGLDAKDVGIVTRSSSANVLENASCTWGISLTQAIEKQGSASPKDGMLKASGDSTPIEARSRLASLASPTWEPWPTESHSKAMSSAKAGPGAFARTSSSASGSGMFATSAAPSPILFGRPAFSMSMDKKIFTGNSVGTGALSHSDKTRASIPLEGEKVSEEAKLEESAAATDFPTGRGDGDEGAGTGEEQKDELPDVVIPETLTDPEELDEIAQELGEDGEKLKKVLSDGLSTGWAGTLASKLSKQVESLKKGELAEKVQQQSFKRRGSLGVDAQAGAESDNLDRVSSQTGDTSVDESLPVIRTAEEVQSQLAKLSQVGITKSFIARRAADRKTAFPSVLDELCSCNMTELRHQRDFGQTQQKRDIDKQVVVERWKSTLTSHSLNVFSLDSPLRARAILLTESPWFERFVQATIVTNVVWFCLGDPESTSGKNRGPHVSLKNAFHVAHTIMHEHTHKHTQKQMQTEFLGRDRLFLRALYRVLICGVPRSFSPACGSMWDL